MIRGQPVESFLKCQKMADFGGIDAACTKQAFDGAFLQDFEVSKVNMGRKSGTCTELKSLRAWLLIIHCVDQT